MFTLSLENSYPFSLSEVKRAPSLVLRSGGGRESVGRGGRGWGKQGFWGLCRNPRNPRFGGGGGKRGENRPGVQATKHDSRPINTLFRMAPPTPSPESRPPKYPPTVRIPPHTTPHIPTPHISGVYFGVGPQASRETIATTPLVINFR